jgi:hypothetical protein
MKKCLLAQPVQPATVAQLQTLIDDFVPAYSHDRLRRDKVDKAGCVTLRLAGRLHHIGVGRTHTGTHVLLLVQGLHVRVIDAATGGLLRDLVLDPTRDYQRTGRPPGPARE